MDKPQKTKAQVRAETKLEKAKKKAAEVLKKAEEKAAVVLNKAKEVADKAREDRKLGRRIKRFWWDPWSQRQKTVFSLLFILALVALVLSFTVRPVRVIEVPGKALPAPPPITVTNEVIKEVTPQGVLDELASLRQEKTADQGTIADLRAQIAKLTAPVPAPSPIIWPKTDKIITSLEARSLLSDTFKNKRLTSVYFGQVDGVGQANLYTVEQFKEIRAKMPSLTNDNLPWPSLLITVVGTFKEPGVEGLRLPIGWAYPTSPDPSLMYLITMLDDGGKAKVFGFDPLDKAKIWEITTDSRVETATVW